MHALFQQCNVTVGHLAHDISMMDVYHEVKFGRLANHKDPLIRGERPWAPSIALPLCWHVARSVNFKHLCQGHENCVNDYMQMEM